MEAEAGHMIDKGFAIQIIGNGKYDCSPKDLKAVLEEKEKLTRSIQKYVT